MNICKPNSDTLNTNNRHKTPSSKRTEYTPLIQRKNSENSNVHTTSDTRLTANNHSSLLSKILKQKETLTDYLKPNRAGQARPKLLEKIISQKNTGKKLDGSEKQVRKLIARSQSAYSNTVNIDSFSIGRYLGRGTNAVVRSATYKPTSEKVALKTYGKFRVSSQSISREINILEKMNHPNIVKLLYKINTPTELHLAMELANGNNLHTFLNQRKKLNEVEFKEIFTQILDAIQYCHSLNITHRDLKLENVILGSDHKVHVIDFGFSTCTSEKTQLFCGTPLYMAPEIIKRREYEGPPVDVWALGVLMFLLLTGQFPFRGTTEKELFKKIQVGEYSFPSHLSQEARATIDKMLSPKPEDRPSVSDLLSSSYFLNSN